MRLETLQVSQRPFILIVNFTIQFSVLFSCISFYYFQCYCCKITTVCVHTDTMVWRYEHRGVYYKHGLTQPAFLCISWCDQT